MLEDILKRIGVVINKKKDVDLTITKILVEKLLKEGFTVVVAPEIEKSIHLPVTISASVFADSDLIICVGGDGTFLKTARQAYTVKKPVLGINRGIVGFLAEVETKDIDKAVDRLAEGNFSVEPRMVLNAGVIRKGEKVYEDIAINDAVVTRMTLSRIVRLKVSIDEKYVDSFPGDGVIVSTPTGSTGYTLAAGGPIVQPDMRLMIVSPICPHILYSRSFIASDDRTVRISIDDCCKVDAMVTVDGQKGFALEPGDLVYVRAAREDALFASVSNVNFYDVLRAKIHG